MRKKVKITTIQGVESVINNIQEAGICYLYIDAGVKNIHTEPYECKLIVLSYENKDKYIIPLYDEKSPFNREEVERILSLIKEKILSNDRVEKIGYDIKFHIHITSKWGEKEETGWRGKMQDIRILSNLLNGDNNVTTTIEEVLTGRSVKSVVGTEYESMFTIIEQIQKIFCEMYPLLEKDKKLCRIYEKLSLPVLSILYQMEAEGMRIDRAKLIKYSREAEFYYISIVKKIKNYPQVQRYIKYKLAIKIGENIQKLNEKIKKENAKKAGNMDRILLYKEKIRELKMGTHTPDVAINFKSPLQLKELLYTKEGFNFKKIKGGGTGKEVLLSLEDNTGIIKDIIELRTIGTIISTYLTGYHRRIDNKGIIHTTFKQDGTATGRLSSENPNIQNIPTTTSNNTEMCRKIVGNIKRLFVVPKDYSIVQVDYSQVELRILASISNEENMIQAYREEKDLHINTACNLLGVDLDAFMKKTEEDRDKWRKRAKAGNFGLCYGMSADGYKEYAKNNYNLDISIEEAEELRRNFYNSYPNILKYHTKIIEYARTNGFVRTLFGRKRYCDGINSNDDRLRSLAERIAINSPIQGTAGEITLFALLETRKILHKDIKIVNTIHDSIIYYVPNNKLKNSIELIERTCCNLEIEKYFNCDALKVPLKVDIEVSKTSWGELEKVK